ncbi:hypothetical protein D0B54_20165 [Solimonas sp. K1W22B-7]|nr:hypothetical protein D0B54_20165 [Solimonas sp. K1W22B-7]
MLLACALGLAATAADAGISRCVNAEGKTYFTDGGCPVSNPIERPKATPRPEAELPPGSLEPVGAAAAPSAVSPAAAPAAKALPSGVVVEAIEPASAVEPATAIEPADATVTPEAVAPVAAEPLRKRQSRSGHWGLVLVGVAIATIGHLWMMGLAWGAGSKLWSFLIFLFAPFANLLYCLLNLREPRTLGSFAMTAGGLALAASLFVPPTELIDVNESYLTARAQTGIEDRAPRERFSSSEKVYMKTVLGWDDWLVGEVPYVVTWAWYTGDEQVAEFSREMEFGAAPKVLEGYWPAAELGPGRHSVELYIDDELIDTREFEIL